MPPTFIHLRLHTEYSLHDGLLQIPALVEKTAALGMPALAITDLSNLYAAVKFYQAAMQAGIKPLLGTDVWVMDDKNPKTPFRLTLLCQTNQGYQNLLKLISNSYLIGQTHDHPLIHARWLQTLATGLIALSGAHEGNIGQALLAQDTTLAETHLQNWQSLFPNRFYLEINRVGKPHESAYLAAVLKLAEAQGVPIVASNDVRFLEQNDFEAHEARVCIQQGVTLNDPQRSRAYTEQQYLRSPAEMQRLFADLPEALTNTIEIAKRCNVTLTLGQNRLPHFAVPDAYTTESYLIEAAKQGLERRLQIIFDAQADTFAIQRRAYDTRLERELTVINEMGFAGYFLIVADFTKWSKDHGIPVGPGRGSGPGSLVAFALNITDLDPIALDLLFERFLNPERVSMPDFDIDFCMDGRDRVIEYVMQKHGHDSVAQIMTYGTMAAKAVVRDVGRILAFAYGFVDKIAKLIPFELGITLEKALEQEPLLRERYEQEEDVRMLIDLALKLEGITRNVGTHAGGIVIAPGKLTDFVPLYCEANAATHPVTQFDKDDVEAVGLVKFDFLGLKTLTIIDRALRIIHQSYPDTKIDITLIPLQDPITFKMLKACKSTAVFQLESHGMRDLIKRLQPDCFEDLVALVALFRPGPLQSGMVDDFINRKHGRARVMYPHPKLEPVLRPTYGVILYQEQVMQIAQVLAGYTLGAADILRRAMGKKKPEEMAKQREIFCQGAVERGVNQELASSIFDLMEKFAGYGFNKSHSASYALIAYQTAWLKAHYPAAFMAAVLSSDMDRTEKVIVFLEECRALKLEVTPPNINQSEYVFKMLDDQHLVYGLGAIKGVGEAAIENIVEARQQGLFTDLFDFCRRVDLRKINKRVFEALIKSGSFDCLKQHRSTLLASLQSALQAAEQRSANERSGQQDLFSAHLDVAEPQYVITPPWSEALRLQGEKETLGFYLTGHPLDRYTQELANVITCRISVLHPSEHQTARAAGIISNIRTRQTKRGDRIAIFSLDDGTGSIEVVCFSESYQKYRSLIVADQLVVIEGDVNLDEFSNKARIVARELNTIDQTRERLAKYVRVQLKDIHFEMASLQACLAPHHGSCAVVLQWLQEGVQTQLTLGRKWLVNPNDALLALLEEQMPVERVEVGY
ncbi:MAG TPA: DNA polymerase III subunit alpha [Gammaproteobacteria bacterium]|nr:DNA polymerase III subunit alpha [Gammaproteobacteria bacterium]